MYKIRNIISEGKTKLHQYTEREANQLMLMLCEYLLSESRTHILAYPDTEVSASDYKKIMDYVTELQNNKPIQYILGETEFFGLTFKVSEDVLIPRPETEELVDLILKTNKQLSPNIIDLGTGSGCIAIALSKNLPHAKVLGCDVSEKAICKATENNNMNSTNVEFLQFDILHDDVKKLPKPIDILVSNPPYVTNKQKQEMNANVLDYEPHNALFISDDNPLLFYKKIADIGNSILSENGLLFFEINELFGKETANMLSDKGYKNIAICKDIFGKDRIVWCSK